MIFELAGKHFRFSQDPFATSSPLSLNSSPRRRCHAQSEINLQSDRLEKVRTSQDMKRIVPGLRQICDGYCRFFGFRVYSEC